MLFAMTIDHAEIDRRIAYHKPSTNVIEQIESVRNAIRDLGHVLVDSLPDSREKTIAITKLEEVTYWSIASVARPPEQ